ncbi:MAG: ABC transporter substrate-binding protein [Spirochaetaceae bacterium]|nr:ABC transporter substrate-binding protein [Myxococcales bacterium]MCB9723767.1 ABC transporter substrate-binding protein [Spirochaetaceae bacterium]HPG25548.1 helical backbone metal receptor [Myxococcota bacterium]
MGREEPDRDRAALLAHPRVHTSLPAAFVASPPRRVVSLVPSLSEALVVLGLGDRLVGVTEYCVEPPGAFDGLPRLGGTKDADVEAIAALRPGLVIGNREENTPRVVRALAERGIDLWLTYPRRVREGAELLRDLARLGAAEDAIARHVAPVFAALERAEAAAASSPVGPGWPVGEAAGASPGPRVFCPIWRDPWMTIGADTYIHDLITLCGGRNVFPTGPDPRRPDRRYPIVTLEAVERADPELILLPDEPWAFGEADVRELAGLDCAAARTGRIHPIDGRMVSWYGPRIAEAIQALARLFATR